MGERLWKTVYWFCYSNHGLECDDMVVVFLDGVFECAAVWGHVFIVCWLCCGSGPCSD